MYNLSMRSGCMRQFRTEARKSKKLAQALDNISCYLDAINNNADDLRAVLDNYCSDFCLPQLLRELRRDAQSVIDLTDKISRLL